MDRRHPLEQIVADQQCMGCGFCTLIRSAQPGQRAPDVVFEYDAGLDFFVPTVPGWTPQDPIGEFVCPGASMDMVALSEQRFGKQPADEMLGEVVEIRAAYSTNAEERARSASGGVVPAILRHLFAAKAVDAAYCLRSETPPTEAAGALVHHASQLTSFHGSVYHPARFGASLKDLAGSNERFAFVGLPCEIAGLEMLKASDPSLRERHVVSIGLFCGGINSFRGIDYYLARFGFTLKDVAEIDYRYGAWPGRIGARLKQGEWREVARIAGNSRWNILRYVIAFQGYWMLPRCRICPDQISDFADIAVGDPHLPRFRHRGGQGFSAVVTRTPRGEEIVRAAIAAAAISDEPLTRAELIQSQGYTLDNRRHAKVYARVARALGFKPPRLTTYAGLDSTTGPRHYRYAIVDLLKLRIPRNRLVRAFYLPWQIFEYLFITFAPTMIGKRIAKLLRNETG